MRKKNYCFLIFYLIFCSCEKPRLEDSSDFVYQDLASLPPEKTNDQISCPVLKEAEQLTPRLSLFDVKKEKEKITLCSSRAKLTGEESLSDLKWFNPIFIFSDKGDECVESKTNLLGLRLSSKETTLPNYDWIESQTKSMTFEEKKFFKANFFSYDSTNLVLVPCENNNSECYFYSSNNQGIYIDSNILGDEFEAQYINCSTGPSDRIMHAYCQPGFTEKVKSKFIFNSDDTEKIKNQLIYRGKILNFARDVWKASNNYIESLKDIGSDQLPLSSAHNISNLGNFSLWQMILSTSYESVKKKFDLSRKMLESNGGLKLTGQSFLERSCSQIYSFLTQEYIEGEQQKSEKILQEKVAANQQQEKKVRF